MTYHTLLGIKHIEYGGWGDTVSHPNVTSLYEEDDSIITATSPFHTRLFLHILFSHGC